MTPPLGIAASRVLPRWLNTLRGNILSWSVFLVLALVAHSPLGMYHTPIFITWLNPLLWTAYFLGLGRTYLGEAEGLWSHPHLYILSFLLWWVEGMAAALVVHGLRRP